MIETLMDWAGRNARILRDAATAIVIGSFLAILSPFGTDELGWPLVWLYWAGLIGFGFVLGPALGGFIQPRIAAWPIPLQLLTLSAAIAVPMTAAVIAVMVVLGAPTAPSPLWSVAFYVLVISIAVTVVTHLADRKAPGDPAPLGTPPFLKRLPAKLTGGEIYAVEAEDHYLRIHTSRGDDLVLMRFSDALGELEGIEGLQVHRSWWVARAGVAKVVRDSDKVVLQLRNNKTVPVSRNNRGAVRKAGWG